ncbi:MAG TPA: glycoside hydrolase family 31 protein [Vicinamibacterales bacterium]|nr:glycoside hydrolase family 31 protein [Vicinamibacterales bacterium]HPW20398.1 glycoside hydrolase family 31 protein [Vicinamibacterales bacterium]
MTAARTGFRRVGRRAAALPLAILAVAGAARAREPAQDGRQPLVLRPAPSPLDAEGATGPSVALDGLHFETAAGRVALPAAMSRPIAAGASASREFLLADDRVVRLVASPGLRAYTIRLSAEPSEDILGWGLSIAAAPGERFTGLLERVADGPQEASRAPDLAAGLDLRGQRVDTLVKPATSAYAPFYVSSGGYGVFVKGAWPGRFDVCAADPGRVAIEFEGPSLELKVYLDGDPAAIVKAHSMEAGPPVLPPKWMLRPWRWRDEHSHRPAYADGTPVTGPFNSQVMEDVLMMRAFGIPNGVYCIDRPHGPDRLGGGEIDPARLPRFADMVGWLNGQGMQALLRIAPHFQGRREREAIERGYTLAGRPPRPDTRPLADFSNPAARALWQDGLSELLKLGVSAYALDPGEADIPDGGPFAIAGGRPLRELRNGYVVMYVEAAYEAAKTHRGGDFLLVPRGAYTGSSKYAAFRGGDAGGTQEGLRASIIAAQRSAVMGYPFRGSGACGDSRQPVEREVCARWIAFSALTPIMEVGPACNLAFWSEPGGAARDEELIAAWRLYARLRERLVEYGYRFVKEASSTGMPVVRPLFLADPGAPQAWTDWATYMYGTDLVVSPIWETGRRQAAVYLPSGSRWRDAWRRDQIHEGGRSVAVAADVHQIPLFVREGSGLDLGDLNREWEDALAAARRRPDLKALDAALAEAWGRAPAS